MEKVTRNTNPPLPTAFLPSFGTGIKVIKVTTGFNRDSLGRTVRLHIGPKEKERVRITPKAKAKEVEKVDPHATLDVGSPTLRPDPVIRVVVHLRIIPPEPGKVKAKEEKDSRVKVKARIRCTKL